MEKQNKTKMSTGTKKLCGLKNTCTDNYHISKNCECCVIPSHQNGTLQNSVTIDELEKLNSYDIEIIETDPEMLRKSQQGLGLYHIANSQIQNPTNYFEQRLTKGENELKELNKRVEKLNFKFTDKYHKHINQIHNIK